MWTHFWDMHSGGTQKLEWPHIYIEAPTEEAKLIFYNRLGRNPDRVSCTCCGEDYATDEKESLEQITAYHRECMFDKINDVWLEKHDPKSLGVILSRHGGYRTLDEYIKDSEVLVITEKEIDPLQRIGEVPEQGFVWIDE